MNNTQTKMTFTLTRLEMGAVRRALSIAGRADKCDISLDGIRFDDLDIIGDGATVGALAWELSKVVGSIQWDVARRSLQNALDRIINESGVTSPLDLQ